MTTPRIRNPESDAGPSTAADARYFAALYCESYQRLTLVAAAVTGERQSAEDIVQEAALIALEKFDQFVPGSNFAAWVAEIVRRCALNYRRKVKARRTFAADPSSLGQMNHAAEPGEPSPVLAGSGRMLPDQGSFDDEMAAALATLGEEARSCLLLRIVEKLPYAEIANLLNIPEGTAMSHVHRSKAALRRQLAPEAADPAS